MTLTFGVLAFGEAHIEALVIDETVVTARERYGSHAIAVGVALMTMCFTLGYSVGNLLGGVTVSVSGDQSWGRDLVREISRSRLVDLVRRDETRCVF